LYLRSSLIAHHPMPSFDIVSETDLQEVDNALQNVAREIGTRYDFKGSKCAVERKEHEITITADDEYKRDQIEQMLKAHITRRKLDAKALEFGKAEPAAGNTLRQKVTVKQGVDKDASKAIIKALKESKMKVQASIQGEEIRVTGKKRDDLQDAIALIKGLELELPLQYKNFRD